MSKDVVYEKYRYKYIINLLKEVKEKSFLLLVSSEYQLVKSTFC